MDEKRKTASEILTNRDSQSSIQVSEVRSALGETAGGTDEMEQAFEAAANEQASRMIIPQEWLVVFKTTSKTRWVNWIPGRFKRCYCMAFIAEFKCWLIVEHALMSGSMVALLPDMGADRWLGEICRDAVVVKVRAGMVQKGLCRGFWPVPLTAHVIGLKSRALLPDRLFRDCLASGGEIVVTGD